MPKNEYLIVDDFQVKDIRVLELDSDYEYGRYKKAVIDGQSYDFQLNSIRKWVTIKSFEQMKGKTIRFE